MEIEWIEPIIPIGEVEHTQGDLGAAVRKPISKVSIEVPEVVSREVGGVTAIALAVLPNRSDAN